MLLMHWIPWLCSLALVNAGSSIAANMAMMAMTTSNSINVNPPPRRGMVWLLWVMVFSRGIMMLPACAVSEFPARFWPFSKGWTGKVGSNYYFCRIVFFQRRGLPEHLTHFHSTNAVQLGL